MTAAAHAALQRLLFDASLTNPMPLAAAAALVVLFGLAGTLAPAHRAGTGGPGLAPAERSFRRKRGSAVGSGKLGVTADPQANLAREAPPD